MDIETLGLLGFTFAATALAVLAYERRMDVLYGPYIQGRAGIPAGFVHERILDAGIVSRRSLSLEGPKPDLSYLDRCLLIPGTPVRFAPRLLNAFSDCRANCF
jgi:hypothetical protein